MALKIKKEIHMLFSAGESQEHQGEIVSFCCHTEISGQKKEVKYDEITKDVLVFDLKKPSEALFSIFLILFASSESVNLQHRPGRCRRSKKAPPPTGPRFYVIQFNSFFFI